MIEQFIQTIQAFNPSIVSTNAINYASNLMWPQPVPVPPPVAEEIDPISYLTGGAVNTQTAISTGATVFTGLCMTYACYLKYRGTCRDYFSDGQYTMNQIEAAITKEFGPAADVIIDAFKTALKFAVEEALENLIKSGTKKLSEKSLEILRKQLIKEKAKQVLPQVLAKLGSPQAAPILKQIAGDVTETRAARNKAEKGSDQLKQLNQTLVDHKSKLAGTVKALLLPKVAPKVETENKDKIKI